MSKYDDTDATYLLRKHPTLATSPQQFHDTLLHAPYESEPAVHKAGCYICEDPEFAQMGLPLCKPCAHCSVAVGKLAGHIPADDDVCTECGSPGYDPGDDENTACDPMGVLEPGE